MLAQHTATVSKLLIQISHIFPITFLTNFTAHAAESPSKYCSLLLPYTHSFVYHLVTVHYITIMGIETKNVFFPLLSRFKRFLKFIIVFFILNTLPMTHAIPIRRRRSSQLSSEVSN